MAPSGAAHIGFQQALNEELVHNGELVDAQGLDGPEQARFVVCDGLNAPVATDGPSASGSRCARSWPPPTPRCERPGRRRGPVAGAGPQALSAVFRRYGHFAVAQGRVGEYQLQAAIAAAHDRAASAPTPTGRRSWPSAGSSRS